MERVEADADAAEVPSSAPLGGHRSPPTCRGIAELPAHPRDPAVVRPTISPAEVACCAAYLDDATQEPAPPRKDSLFVGCCNVVVLDSLTPSDRSVGNEVRMACCFADNSTSQPDLWDYPLCSPWGPPVPPAMSGPLRSFRTPSATRGVA